MFRSLSLKIPTLIRISVSAENKIHPKEGRFREEVGSEAMKKQMFAGWKIGEPFITEVKHTHTHTHTHTLLSCFSHV